MSYFVCCAVVGWGLGRWVSFPWSLYFLSSPPGSNIDLCTFVVVQFGMFGTVALLVALGSGGLQGYQCYRLSVLTEQINEVQYEVFSYSTWVRETWNSRIRLRRVMHPDSENDETSDLTAEYEFVAVAT